MTAHRLDHDCPSQFMDGQIPDYELFPAFATTEQFAELLLDDMPSQAPPSTSTSSRSTMTTPIDTAMQCSPVWPSTVVQQPKFPPRLPANPVYPDRMALSYQPYAFEAGHHGLGTDFSDALSTYGLEPAVNTNQVFFKGPPEADACDDSYDGTSPSDLAHDFRPMQVADEECSHGTDGDAEQTKHVSYAKELFACLLQAKDHMLPLQEIYEWVRKNTNKAPDPSKSGWMNSVRHNLSMNKAFERVPASSRRGGKQGGPGLWHLADSWVQRGVISTTRFRKQSQRKQAPRVGAPAPKRREAGAKGGKATAAASRRNRKLNQRAKFAQATSAPIQHPANRYHHNTRLATAATATSSTSIPALVSPQSFDAPLPDYLAHTRFPSIPTNPTQSFEAPLPAYLPYTRFPSIPTNSMQFRSITPMSTASMHTMANSPISPALGQWELPNTDTTMGGIIAEHDPAIYNPGSTPGLTSDSSPWFESVNSFDPFSRDSSVAF